MPYGGNDWLALTQESTLEPEIPICDPHHHFWDLRPERIPYQPAMKTNLFFAQISADIRLRTDAKDGCTDFFFAVFTCSP